MQISYFFIAISIVFMQMAGLNASEAAAVDYNQHPDGHASIPSWLRNPSNDEELLVKGQAGLIMVNPINGYILYYGNRCDDAYEVGTYVYDPVTRTSQTFAQYEFEGNNPKFITHCVSRYYPDIGDKWTETVDLYGTTCEGKLQCLSSYMPSAVVKRYGPSEEGVRMIGADHPCWKVRLPNDNSFGSLLTKVPGKDNVLLRRGKNGIDLLNLETHDIKSFQTCSNNHRQFFTAVVPLQNHGFKLITGFRDAPLETTDFVLEDNNYEIRIEKVTTWPFLRHVSNINVCHDLSGQKKSQMVAYSLRNLYMWDYQSSDPSINPACILSLPCIFNTLHEDLKYQLERGWEISFSTPQHVILHQHRHGHFDVRSIGRAEESWGPTIIKHRSLNQYILVASSGIIAVDTDQLREKYLAKEALKQTCFAKYAKTLQSGGTQSLFRILAGEDIEDAVRPASDIARATPNR